MSRDQAGGEYLEPGTTIGAYVIRGYLGEGSGSVVYDVESKLGNHYALKLSRRPRGPAPWQDWYQDERFTRNIECLEQLRGVRWVARIEAHDRYPDPQVGRQYLVQELVPGGLTITEWTQRTSPSLKQIVTAFKQLAEACGEMAKAGILNRDLKPANILMTPDGEPRIVDFDCGTWPGASKELTSPAAMAIPGTPAYQPPEVCAALLEERELGQSVPVVLTPSADLHSLGAILYRVLTGKHPFDLKKPEKELLQDIAFVEPPPPAVLQPVPTGLSEVVMKMLKKDLARRYQNGHEVARDLEVLLSSAADESWSAPYHVAGTTPSPAAVEPALPPAVQRALAILGALEPAPAPPPASRRARVWHFALAALAGLLLVTGLALGLRRPPPDDARSASPQPAAPTVAAEQKGLTIVSQAVPEHPIFTATTGMRVKTLALAGACGALACAGVQVRTGDLDWLANCPAEARRTVRVFGLGREGDAMLHEGPNVKPHNIGCEVRNGPVEVYPGLRNIPEDAKFVGTIRTGADGASLRFHKLVLANGFEYPICAVAAEYFEWGPGIDKVKDDAKSRAPASELTPDWTYVTTGRLKIRLAY